MADTIVSTNVNVTTKNVTEVTVAAGANKRLTINNGGFNYVFKAGDKVEVPSFEVARLRRDGVIV